MSETTVITPEILTAVLSQRVDGNSTEIKSDAVGYINRTIGVDLSSCDLNVVENSEAKVHLALPYYDSVEEQTAHDISDRDLHDASAGTNALILQATRFAANAIAASGDATALAMIRHVELYLLNGEEPPAGTFDNFGG